MKRKSIILVTTTLLFVLYTILDNYGYQNYLMLLQAYGTVTVTLTILLNILISFISGYTISLTLGSIKVNKGAPLSLATVGNFVAALFAGCTSCGLNLFAAIGIGFIAPIVTPGAIPYKLFALAIVIVSYFVIQYRIKHSTCEVI